MTDLGLSFDAKQYGSCQIPFRVVCPGQIPFRVVCPEGGCCNVSENDV